MNKKALNDNASYLATDRRIPVTLLTGFLGAGKTTLLNHLVHLPEMAGAAVLINEFGEVGIDHHLVDMVDETLMILDSGCLCCSMQGDLVKALKTLSDRSSKREIPPISRVLIETTGLADPVPVIYTLMQELFVAARYRCDGVVTAVDATHALEQLDTHFEAVRQVAMADRLLITKCDLATRETLELLNSKLNTLNPGASKIEVQYGQISPDGLFGIGIYTTAGKLPDVAAWLGEEEIRNRQHNATLNQLKYSRSRKGAHHSHSKSPERHDKLIKSFVVNFPSPTPWYGLALAMGRILEMYGSKLLRVKGLMNIIGDNLPRVIHCVQDVAYPPLNLGKWPDQSPFEDRCGRLVFIVRDLSALETEDIQRELSNLTNDPATQRAIAACPIPTRCWLTHNLPGSVTNLGNSAIKADGWNVQIKALAKR